MGSLYSKMADGSTEDQVKGQFTFCTICRLNHDQGRKHIYSRKHKTLLGKTLLKFGKKVDEARKFLKKPSVEDGELEPGSRFWCHFCTENVNKHVTDGEVSIKYGGVFEHFASENHRKNLHKYWWENGADKNLKSKFLVDQEKFNSYKEEVNKKLQEFEAQMEEKRQKAVSQIKHKEVLQAHTSHQPPEIQVTPEVVVYKTVQSEQGILQNPTGWFVSTMNYKLNKQRLVDTKSRRSTNEGNEPLDKCALTLLSRHEGQRVWGGGIVKYRPGSTQWFPWIMDSIDDASKSFSSSKDVTATQVQTAEAFAENLTCIGIPELKKGEGNIHTGATPPWLREDDDDDCSNQASNTASKEVIGPSYNEFKKHVERMKKIKNKNPQRVGANFDRKKETSDDWLPSFGRVWNHGPRWQSRHDFRGETKKSKRK